jgi:hypothetical protein
MISIIVYQEDILVLTSSSFYQDDILVLTSSSFNDHLRQLGNIFKWLHHNNLQDNAKKLTFCALETKYFGFILTREGIKPQQQKVNAILQIAPPHNIEQVGSFIGGMLNYYKAMIPCKTPSFYHCLLHLPRRMSNLNGQQNINKPSTHSKIHSLAKLSSPTWTSPFPSKSTPTPQNTKLDLSLPKRQATCILFKETY